MEAHFSEDVVVRAYLDCLENMSRFPARSAG
jgi:hypothetical protein